MPRDRDIARAFLSSRTRSRLVLAGSVTGREIARLAAELTADGQQRPAHTARDHAHLMPDVLTVDLGEATSLDADAVALISALSSQCLVRGRWLTVVDASGAVLKALADAGITDVVLLALRGDD